MSIQVTYAIDGLDLQKTYDNLWESKLITGLDSTKGTASLWLGINGESVKVQISNKGVVNIWHKEQTHIDGAVEKLKSLVINSEGGICKDWVLTNAQKIGSTRIASPLTEEVSAEERIREKKPLASSEEADPKEVSDCILKLNKTEDEDLIKIRIEDLKRLCDGKRVAPLPNVLNFLDNSLLNPKFRNPEIRSNLIECLCNVLHFENKREVQKEDEIKKRIIDNIKTIKQIISEEYDLKVVKQSLCFFAETGTEEAVNSIFNLAIDLPDEKYENIYREIKDALHSGYYPLNDKHREMINQKVDDMIIDKNPAIKRRGLVLYK
ncbi:MAG: hypothetical protein V1850_05370 [Candidatus Bathyarchaeota archaeon]